MSESNERSGTSETPEQPKAEERSPEGSQLEKLHALFNEEGAGDGDEGDAGGSQQNAEPEAGKPKGKPKKLNDLAERLGVELDDLYKLEVTASKDGSPVTVEMLKDAHAKQDDLTVRELAFEERRSKQEAEWTRAQTEFQQLVAMLDPKAVTPALRDKVRQKIDADVKRERELTLKHIPEWQDATVRDAEIGAMVEFLKDFGIPETYLLTGMSHKLFRMVRYATLQKQRLEKAFAKVEAIKKPSTTGKSGASHGAPRKPPASKPQSRSSDRERVLSVLQ